MNVGTGLLTFVFLAVTLTACGRRGDPFLVEPSIQKDAVTEAGEQKSKGQVPAEQATDSAAVPPVPTGLNGVYTQHSIILTWDYIDDQKIKYKVYRSEGSMFEFVGESVTPVFTDKNAKAGVTYHYRVTAVGASEGPPSKEIIIITEIH